MTGALPADLPRRVPGRHPTTATAPTASPQVTANLGPAYPNGLFVCQDNNNDAPGAVGNQDLKYVPLEDVVDLDVEPPPPPPPPPPSTIEPVSASVVNANTTAWSRPVPGSVQPGDGMLLLFSRSADSSALTGPGAGWTTVGTLLDSDLRTTIWQKVATAADAGSSVTVSGGGGASQGRAHPRGLPRHGAHRAVRHGRRRGRAGDDHRPHHPGGHRARGRLAPLLTGPTATALLPAGPPLPARS